MAQSLMLRRISAQNRLRLIHGKFVSFSQISVSLKASFCAQSKQKQNEIDNDDDAEDEQVCSQSVYFLQSIISGIQ